MKRIFYLFSGIGFVIIISSGNVFSIQSVVIVFVGLCIDLFAYKTSTWTSRKRGHFHAPPGFVKSILYKFILSFPYIICAAYTVIEFLIQTLYPSISIQTMHVPTFGIFQGQDHFVEMLRASGSVDRANAMMVFSGNIFWICLISVLYSVFAVGDRNVSAAQYKVGLPRELQNSSSLKAARFLFIAAAAGYFVLNRIDFSLKHGIRSTILSDNTFFLLYGGMMCGISYICVVGAFLWQRPAADFGDNTSKNASPGGNGDGSNLL